MYSRLRVGGMFLQDSLKYFRQNADICVFRIVLALKSGQLMESTWALDTLNVLLFDDNSVAYFGLGNMPGLLDALIDTWRAALIQVFDVARDLETSTPKTELQRKRKREKIEKSLQGVKW